MFVIGNLVFLKKHQAINVAFKAIQFTYELKIVSKTADFRVPVYLCLTPVDYYKPNGSS